MYYPIIWFCVNMDPPLSKLTQRDFPFGLFVATGNLPTHSFNRKSSDDLLAQDGRLALGQISWYLVLDAISQLMNPFLQILTISHPRPPLKAVVFFKRGSYSLPYPTCTRDPLAQGWLPKANQKGRGWLRSPFTAAASICWFLTLPPFTVALVDYWLARLVGEHNPPFTRALVKKRVSSFQHCRGLFNVMFLQARLHKHVS